MMHLMDNLFSVVAGIAAIPSIIILIQCLVAWLFAEHAASVSGGEAELLVLIPAHDEEMGIVATCDAIRNGVIADKVKARVVVVADNCSDKTPVLARAAGVEVLERQDADRRGKGYALAWASASLVKEPWGGLVVLDADARPEPGFFAAIANEIDKGTDAVQAFYSIKANQNKRAALMQLALALFNGARPLGRYVMGGSASITGNGFALSRGCLKDVPFEPSAALAEDLEHGLGLVSRGYRVKLLMGARVSTAPAGDDANTRTQRTRWEAGRLRAVRRWVPRLLSHPTWPRLESAIDLLIPPMALTTSLQLAIGCCALACGQYVATCLIAGSLATALLSLVLACRITGLPLRTLFVLRHVAWYVFWKMGIYLGSDFWRQKAWVRTARAE